MPECCATVIKVLGVLGLWYKLLRWLPTISSKNLPFSTQGLCEWEYCLQLFSSVLESGRSTMQVMVFGKRQSYCNWNGSLFIPMFCRVAGKIQMEKECSYRLCFPGHPLKAFRTNFKKRWQLHTCSCALNPKVQFVSPKVTKTTEALLPKMKKIWVLNTRILSYYNNYPYSENSRAYENAPVLSGEWGLYTLAKTIEGVRLKWSTG